MIILIIWEAKVEDGVGLREWRRRDQHDCRSYGWERLRMEPIQEAGFELALIANDVIQIVDPCQFHRIRDEMVGR